MLLLRGAAAVRPQPLLLRSLPRNIISRHRSSSLSSFPTPLATPLLQEAAARVRAATEPAVGPHAKIDPIPIPNIVAPLPFWQRLGPLTRAGQAYARAQRARPWTTQVISALCIYLCADFGAQWMGAGKADEDGVKKHDWARTARSLIVGGSVAIPGFLWFTFLSRSFNYSSRVLSIAVKVAVNQLTFTPLFNVYFFGAQALLSGDNLAEAWRRVCNTVPVSFVNSCKLWPAVTAFSFAFIPFEYRSVFGGVIAVGWQTYLSFLNGRAESLEAQRQEGKATTTTSSSQVLASAVSSAPVTATPEKARKKKQQQQQQQQTSVSLMHELSTTAGQRQVALA